MTTLSTLQTVYSFGQIAYGTVQKGNDEYNAITRASVKQIITAHAPVVNGVSNIDSFLEQLQKQRFTLTREKMTEFYDTYMKTKFQVKLGLFDLNNVSDSSSEMWEYRNNATISDEERAAKVLEYICDPKRWHHRSCLFLWKNAYGEGKTFNLNPATHSSEAEAAENNTQRPSPQK